MDIIIASPLCLYLNLRSLHSFFVGPVTRSDFVYQVVLYKKPGPNIMIATEGPEMTQYQQLPENREPLKNLDFESGSNVADKKLWKNVTSCLLSLRLRLFVKSIQKQPQKITIHSSFSLDAVRSAQCEIS
jgi:hypothetical protein